MSATATAEKTITDADVTAVMRRVTADLVMIAQSSGSITEPMAREYAHDMEVLAQARYLRIVDVTLLSGGEYGTEMMATRYVPNTAAGGLTSSRPGGVRWPRVPAPYLRVVLTYVDAYDAAARARMASKLKVNWVPCDADTRHLALSATGGRDYVSGAYGMQRRDFA